MATEALIAKLKECIAMTDPLSYRSLNFNAQAKEAGWSKLIDRKKYGKSCRFVNEIAKNLVSIYDLTDGSFRPAYLDDLDDLDDRRNELSLLLNRLLGYATAQLHAKQKLAAQANKSRRPRIKPEDAVRCMTEAKKVADIENTSVESVALRSFAAYGWTTKQFEAVRKSASRAIKKAASGAK